MTFESTEHVCFGEAKSVYADFGTVRF